MVFFLEVLQRNRGGILMVAIALGVVVMLRLTIF